jgi:hypothetical protein
MTHTQQSKQNSTLESELWFSKNNYMSQFLNAHSKEIIKKLNNEYRNPNR